MLRRRRGKLDGRGSWARVGNEISKRRRGDKLNQRGREEPVGRRESGDGKQVLATDAVSGYGWLWEKKKRKCSPVSAGSTATFKTLLHL